jgi:hypothetical protein
VRSEGRTGKREEGRREETPKKKKKKGEDEQGPYLSRIK